MQNLIDVIKYLELIGFFENEGADETLLSTSAAFDNGVCTDSIDNDSNSLLKALDEHDKIFIARGVFGYEDHDGPCFRFGEYYSIEDSKFADQYYDKYKFSLAGYGIYLDKNINIEPGYFTIEAPPSGHGPGGTTFHDFKDAKEEDIIKEQADSDIDYLWEYYFTKSIYNIDENNPILELTAPLIQFIFDKSFDFKEKKNILNDLIKYIQFISNDLDVIIEDSTDDISSAD